MTVTTLAALKCSAFISREGQRNISQFNFRSVVFNGSVQIKTTDVFDTIGEAHQLLSVQLLKRKSLHLLKILFRSSMSRVRTLLLTLTMWNSLIRHKAAKAQNQRAFKSPWPSLCCHSLLIQWQRDGCSTAFDRKRILSSRKSWYDTVGNGRR